MALASGLSGPSASAAKTSNEESSRPPPAAHSAPNQPEAAEGAAKGGMSLKAGLVGVRLKVFNDCPGFRFGALSQCLFHLLCCLSCQKEAKSGCHE